MLAQKKHGKYNYIMSEIRGKLMALADKDYKAFSEKLVLSSKPLIGVRLPQLKKIAKTLAKDFENSFCDIKTGRFYLVLRGICGIMMVGRDEYDQVHIRFFEGEGTDCHARARL